MKTNIFTHIKIIIDKATIFFVENKFQKVGQSFFSLVPLDNRGPTSVFTGTGQSDKR
jgi:hypothetical protein